MKVCKEFAILAPVPEEYLVEGAEVCGKHGKVAFGSNAWETWREIDRLRGGLAVEVLIYASHSSAHPRGTMVHEVAWRARYVGHVESKHGSHPDGMTYRPPSTAKHRSDNRGHFALFWELRDLRALPVGEHLRIVDLKSYRTHKHYAANFVPEGPVLIELPWGEADGAHSVQ